MRHILGISAFYHDAAAALLRDGQILAAAQEERFSRKKNDERFPHHAIQFCLTRAGLAATDLDAVVFYDKPISKFGRLIESFLAVAPAGMTTFLRVAPNWLGEKLNLRQTIRDELPALPERCPILFTEHHQAHAASAFYPSPFEEAAILTVDGVGEWATTTLGAGHGSRIELLQELRFPHSLGLLYSAFTAYCRFRVNSGEYKLMGLAPYGEPRFVQAIYDHLLDLKPDGSFWLNLDYFHFLRGFQMTNDRFHRLFKGPPRSPEAPLEQRHADVAASIQTVTNEVMLRLARQVRTVTGQKNLCLAGGVALNCVANGLILREGIFDRLWIQPAAGDAGGALGAALAVWHNHPASAATARVPAQPDAMQGAFLGPEFSDAEIKAALDAHQAVYQQLPEEALLDQTVALLRQEKVVGWFQGRMEFGPRALGNRSILGDPRSPRMQSVMNLKVKFRESFRPFAPVVLREHLEEYFDLSADSPYMLLVAPVRESLRLPTNESPLSPTLSPRKAGGEGGDTAGADRFMGRGLQGSGSLCANGLSLGLPTHGSQTGLDRIKQIRSTLPAVTHVDYSARIQTLTKEQNPKLHALLERFRLATGCAVLVNTSFNVRGEPVVCTPDDAYRCFVNTEMDHLVIGNFILARTAQPHRQLARTFAPVPD